MQIIAIKMELCCAKRRSKALQVAASAQGVVSVELGEDQVIVAGDEVDAVCLSNSLRKKFGYAKLLSLQHVNPTDNSGGGDGSSSGGGDMSQGNEEDNKDEPSSPPGCACNCCQFPPPPPLIPATGYVLLDADPYPTICSIM